MPRRRKKTTRYDWSNDPDCTQIRSSNMPTTSPEEMAEMIAKEKAELKAEAKRWKAEAKAARAKEDADFNAWLKQNPNKTRYDWEVSIAKSRKSGIGWCGFGR